MGWDNPRIGPGHLQTGTTESRPGVRADLVGGHRDIAPSSGSAFVLAGPGARASAASHSMYAFALFEPVPVRREFRARSGGNQMYKRGPIV